MTTTPTNSQRAAESVAPSLRRILSEPALTDWVVLVYLAVIFLFVWSGKHGADRDHFLAYLGALFAGYAGVVIAYRALLPGGALWPRLYRTAPMVAACAVYFRLAEVFPIVNPREYDGQLNAIDRWIFGNDLSLWVEQFTTRAITDWFSLCYWLYFPMALAAILWGIVFCTDPQLRARFAVGTLMTFLVGHVVYTIVPGLGPWHFLADQYQRPLEGGWFFQANWRTYRTGAGHDIFPSLHTAVSLWLCLFFGTLRNNRLVRLLFWPLVFVSANIIIATIVLRWHYFVDLVAGAALAYGCHVFSRRGVDIYEETRARSGVSPAYW